MISPPGHTIERGAFRIQRFVTRLLTACALPSCPPRNRPEERPWAKARPMDQKSLPGSPVGTQRVQRLGGARRDTWPAGPNENPKGDSAMFCGGKTHVGDTVLLLHLGDGRVAVRLDRGHRLLGKRRLDDAMQAIASAHADMRPYTRLQGMNNHGLGLSCPSAPLTKLWSVDWSCRATHETCLALTDASIFLRLENSSHPLVQLESRSDLCADAHGMSCSHSSSRVPITRP